MHGDRLVSRTCTLLKVWKYELRTAHRAGIGFPLMKSTPIDPYNHEGIWKQRSRRFKRFDIFILGFCHVSKREGVWFEDCAVDGGCDLEAEHWQMRGFKATEINVYKQFMSHNRMQSQVYCLDNALGAASKLYLA